MLLAALHGSGVRWPLVGLLVAAAVMGIAVVGMRRRSPYAGAQSGAASGFAALWVFGYAAVAVAGWLLAR